jgi:hypothetical protein
MSTRKRASRYIVWTELGEESLSQGLSQCPQIQVIRLGGSKAVVMMTPQDESALRRVMPSICVEEDMQHTPA